MRSTPKRPRARLATSALVGVLLVTGSATAALPSASANPRVDSHADASYLTSKRSAAGKIVLFKSVAGIKVGMTRRAVLDRLGKPNVHTEAHEDFYDTKALQLDVRYPRGGNSAKVMLVGTRNPRHRTSKGIHPGSSLKALRKAYANQRLFYDPSTFTGTLTNRAGISTYFSVSRKGEVFSIAVGRLS